MWSRMDGRGDNKTWVPNHFVPLVTEPTTSKDYIEISHNEDDSVDIPKTVFDHSSTTSPDDNDTERTENAPDAHSTPLSTPLSSKRQRNPKRERETNLDLSPERMENVLILDPDVHSTPTSIDETCTPNTLGMPINGFVSPDTIFNMLTSKTTNVENSVPRGKKEYVLFLVDNSDNVKRREAGKKSDFSDDCGVWDSSVGSTKPVYFIHSEGKLEYVAKKGDEFGKAVGKKKVWKAVEPQPAGGDVVCMKRYYSTCKRDPNFKKRISWLERIPNEINDNCPAAKNLAVVEYVGKWPRSVSLHGNAKKSQAEYVRTKTITKDAIKEMVKTAPPREVYQKLVLDFSVDAPRDLKQVQNFKYKNDGNANDERCQNNADELQALQRHMLESKFIQEIVQVKSKDGTPKPPCIILYTEEQLKDLLALCLNKNLVAHHAATMGVDRTFNLGPCYVTTIVYKNNKLIRKTSQDSPILLGPMYLHWDAEFHTYHRFFSHLQSKFGSTVEYASIGFSEVIVGSDEERAIVNAFEMCFPGATVVLCMRHMEENVKRKLTDLRATNTQKQEIIRDIFREKGLANLRDCDEFDQRHIQLRQKYDAYNLGFVDYYVKLSEKIRKHAVLPHVKHEDLATSWTNNNCESLNHILKLAVNWKPQKVTQLVDKLHDIIKLQTIDTRRALYGQGNFEVAPWMKMFKTTSAAWESKTKSQKDELFSKFVAYKRPAKPQTITSTDGKLIIPRTPTTAKKPGQRKRARCERTVTVSRK